LKRARIYVRMRAGLVEKCRGRTGGELAPGRRDRSSAAQEGPMLNRSAWADS